MDESSGPSGISVDDTRQVFDRLADPGTPLTTTEVADELDCSCPDAARTLEALTEEGALKRKPVGSDDSVWWQPQGHGGQACQQPTAETDWGEEFRTLVQAVEEYAIFKMDPDGYVRSWNAGAERIKGYSEREIVGEHFAAFYPDEAVEAGDPERNLEAARTNGHVEDEGWRVRKDGSRFWANVTITSIRGDDGELRGFAKVTRDMTERKRHEDRLAALDELGRELLEADTPGAVSETVADAAETDLDLPISVIALYDDESGTLRPAGRTTRAEQLCSDVPFLDPASDVPWEAFGSEEPLVVDELADRSEQPPADPPVTSGVIVPLGRHGVFIAGFTTADGPNEAELDFAKVVAADLEAALNHAERYQLLLEREATLEDRNESLGRVNRVNDVIRTIDQALIDASTREELEQVACDELAAAGPYRVAWIGRPRPGTDVIAPEAWAGTDQSYVDEVASADDGGPTGEPPSAVAARLREPYAVHDVRSDPPFEPWRKAALKRGYRSLISVPILYEDSCYGVLTVQADEPNTFIGMEAQVIEELGGTVGHAISALESKYALVSDEIVEIELYICDPEIPILRLVDHADCAFDLDSVLSRENALSVFFTTRGATPAEVSSFVDQSLAVSDIRLVSEDDGECTFEATVTDESFVATLLDHGAVPQTITAEGGDGRVVVTLPPQADVREFVEMFQAKYSASELTARRTRDRTARTPHEFKATFEDRTTDRQREVLRMAYFSGFFETPRKSTGEEIAEALGVSQPTVNHHLRACQRELLGVLFEDERPSAAALLDR